MDSNINNNTLSFPEGFEPTLNAHGVTMLQPGELTKAYIDYLDPKQHQVALDIGAAFGVATIPVLKKGIKVIANDLSQEHLDKITQRCPQQFRSNLTLLPGRFPDEITMHDNSLDAVIASNVFHFLTGEEIERGGALIYRWLKPGGQFFLRATSPYTSAQEKFLPHYKERIKKGMKWPGITDGMQNYISVQLPFGLPAMLHALDDVVLRRAFTELGFEIIKCELFRAKNLPEYLYSDGRENVQLIARKPKS